MGALSRAIRDEHAVVGELLGRMRTAADNYARPDWACNSYRALFHELERLETDEPLRPRVAQRLHPCSGGMNGPASHRPPIAGPAGAPQRHRLRLVEGRMLSPAVRGLRFVAEGTVPAYRAGQSMDLLVPTRGGLIMRRPYSVSSAPGHAGPGGLEFAVTRVEGGPTSTALHELQPGALVEAVGPNRGWLARRGDEHDVPALLVATGSGLAPFRAVLQEELQRADGPPIALLFGCRTRADILWRDELEHWAVTRPHFSLQVTLSRPDAEWRGATGWVQRHVVDAVRRVDPGLVLLCGLSPMTDAVERIVVDAGLAASRIRVEAYDA